MKRKLLALACLLAAGQVMAESAMITYTLPTTYVGGAAMPATDIANTTVEYGTCTVSGTFNVKSGENVVPSPGVTTTFNNLTPGRWCFRAFVTTIPARGSRPSTITMSVLRDIPFPAPNPPTILDVIIAAIKRFFGWFA